MKNILLQKNNKYTINEDINIILSAELYSVRIFDIPIESTTELKLVIPDFFEEYFDITEYSFYHIKLEKHKYLCFAYNQDEILDNLKNSNIDLKFVKNIYFLQNELKYENNNIYKYNEIKYIYKDDLLVKIPSNISLSSVENDIDIDNITLSKHNVFLNKSSKYIDNKSAYVISFILIVFALFNFYKMSVLNNQIDKYDQNLDTLKQKFEIPSSMIQTKSIINEYKSIQNTYKEYLTALEYILNYKQSVNTVLNDVEYKNNKLLISFENKNKNKIESYINKKYKIISSKVYNNILSIEVKI